MRHEQDLRLVTAAAIAGQAMGSRHIRLFLKDLPVKQPGMATGAPRSEFKDWPKQNFPNFAREPERGRWDGVPHTHPIWIQRR